MSERTSAGKKAGPPPAGALRSLPRVDALLSHPRLAESGLPRWALRTAVRKTLDEARAALTEGRRTAAPTEEEAAALALSRAEALLRPRLRPVVNGTGVVLHTNLGRAPLSRRAAEAAAAVSAGWSTLEYDLSAGGRGSRQAHVKRLLCALTGAEDALAVNNNAAAVLLMLAAAGSGKGVALSRGELVEIGGSFRVPDIMARSGARLVEVGTTNKTHLSDYRRALDAGAAQVLLKVHTSNFQVVGFTQSVGLARLARLAEERCVPLLYDMGSGGLYPHPALPDGPTASESLAAGADVVCFSGDKLLGGPQAGILLGRRRWISAMAADPLARALRPDKLTLAALEATLLAWQDPEGAWELPVLSMLGASPQALEARAREGAAYLSQAGGGRCRVAVTPVSGPVGGGSLPGVELSGWAVSLVPLRGGVAGLERHFRSWTPAIVGRVHKGALLLDVRTLRPEDWPDIAAALAAYDPEEGRT